MSIEVGKVNDDCDVDGRAIIDLLDGVADVSKNLDIGLC